MSSALRSAPQISMASHDECLEKLAARPRSACSRPERSRLRSTAPQTRPQHHHPVNHNIHVVRRSGDRPSERRQRQPAGQPRHSRRTSSPVTAGQCAGNID
ncbi:hypothetical protein AB0L70_34005 [Kribbella sp. NPDC051952]|uniref:hypothetical protein n=1 Tax=Kribbella sp. NPDC051952 TaxID=3154851 RepID=UPI0034328FB7